MRIAGKHECGIIARRSKQLAMYGEIGNPENRYTRLPRAQHLAPTAQLQVLFGNAETVVGLAHDLKPRFGHSAERALIKEHAGGLASATTDAATQLMELSEAKALGILDDHHARLRHIDPDFDDRRRNENRDLALAESCHHGILVRPAHAAVNKTNLAGKVGRQGLETL